MWTKPGTAASHHTAVLSPGGHNRYCSPSPARQCYALVGTIKHGSPPSSSNAVSWCIETNTAVPHSLGSAAPCWTKPSTVRPLTPQEVLYPGGHNAVLRSPTLRLVLPPIGHNLILQNTPSTVLPPSEHSTVLHPSPHSFTSRAVLPPIQHNPIPQPTPRTHTHTHTLWEELHPGVHNPVAVCAYLCPPDPQFAVVCLSMAECACVGTSAHDFD